MSNISPSMIHDPPEEMSRWHRGTIGNQTNGAFGCAERLDVWMDRLAEQRSAEALAESGGSRFNGPTSSTKAAGGRERGDNKARGPGPAAPPPPPPGAPNKSTTAFYAILQGARSSPPQNT